MALTKIQDEMLADNIGTCKAWVRFNGTGTVSINGAYNISSITDNGVGSYDANFTNPMPDTNYCAVSSSTLTTFANANINTSVATTYVRLATANDAGTGADRSALFIAVFGD